MEVMKREKITTVMTDICQIKSSNESECIFLTYILNVFSFVCVCSNLN